MNSHLAFTLPEIFRQVVENHGKLPFVSFVGESPVTYAQAMDRVTALQAMLQKMNIEKGDRVAILSTNMPHWGIAYLAITGMGAAVVPLLPDFSVEEVKNVLTHSEAKAIFVSSGLRPKIASYENTCLHYRIAIEDFSVYSGINPEVTYNEKETKRAIAQYCWRHSVGPSNLQAGCSLRHSITYRLGLPGNRFGCANQYSVSDLPPPL